MSKRKLNENEIKAVQEAAAAIMNAKMEKLTEEKKENVNSLVTRVNSLGRGFNAKKRTNAIKVLIAIEGFLYEESSAEPRPFYDQDEKHRIYKKGLKTGPETRLKYKGENEEKLHAKLIEDSGLNGGDVAIAVMEFLKTEKLQPETSKEAAKALELENAGVNTEALGRQMILRAGDITQEDVTRALKGIASNIDRLAKEEELRQEEERLRQEATKLKIMNERIKDEWLRKFGALLGVELNGEEDSVYGDDVESLNSWHEAIRNESELSSVDGSGGASSKSSIQSTQSASIKSVSTTANKSRLSSFGGAGSSISEALIQRTPSNSSEFVDQDVENDDVNNEILNNLTRLNEELQFQINDLKDRYDALSALQKKEADRVSVVEAKLEQHLVDPNAHPNLTRGVGFLGGGAGVGVDYSGDIGEIKKEMDRMLQIQVKVEAYLLAAKTEAEARELRAKNEAEERELQAKKDAEARELLAKTEAEERELKAKNEAEERLKTLSEDQKREFEALRKQAADHQAAEKKAREEKEARELAEKERRDNRSWPIRISKVALNALGHYKNDLDEAGKAHTVKIPEISGRIREDDKTMELHESGLSVAIYDFGKRGLTYLGHDVDAAGNTAADRESMMTIARVIDPKGDGNSADVYCVISSSPERGMSTTYISKNTFDDIALKSLKEYENAALATAKLVELNKALEVLEAGRKRAYKAMGLKDDPISADDNNFSVDDNNFSVDDNNFSVDGGERKSGSFSEHDAKELNYKIKALKKVIKDAEISLKPESTKAEADRVKREAVLEILSDYQSWVRKVFAAVRTFDGSDEEREKQLEDGKNNLKNDSGDGLPDLHGIYQKKLLGLGLSEGQIDEILGSDDLISSLYSIESCIESGDFETFDNFGENLQRSQEIVEDLYPTRSHALKRAAQYSLEREFGDLTNFSYQDAAGEQQSFLTAEQGDALKSAMAESSNTKKCLEKLTIVEKDNARRIASTEFSRNAAREIEMANKDKLDFNEFEKEAATAQLVQHWKSNRFFTGSNALASKETDVKEFFEKAKMSDGPYPGPQVTRPNRRNDMATVVFNGVNRFDPKSEDGYEGDDIMYLHVRGTLAPKALYVKVQVATADNQEVKFYKDGKETTKIFQYGDLIIDESTVYTKDSLGNHNPQGVSSLGKADQSLCKNFKVKAMSVIDGERKTAILFEGVPITPQNGLAKAAQVQEVPVIPLHECTPLVSLVTKKTINKKGKEISDTGIYLRDASDPNKPAVLTGPLMNDAKLEDELKKHGVSKAPSCEELKKKIKLPETVVTSPSLAKTNLYDMTNLPEPPRDTRRGGGITGGGIKVGGR